MTGVLWKVAMQMRLELNRYISIYVPLLSVRFNLLLCRSLVAIWRMISEELESVW
jgi:hypothetical protein